ncbi:MAG: aspartate aminotransferase family protein [Planctomycetes bacterium]|nr:aspartate aminotransferase family protein [Planctomycetota bacterium]
MAHKLKYSMTPVAVAKVNTKNRRIATKLPVPQSIPIFRKLLKYEPISMQGQPPVIWDRAEGFSVHDRWGNRWIDWSSCVLVSNVGHGHPAIVKVIKKIADRPLIATYVFAHEGRAELCERLAKIAPPGLNKVFLLSTGSEAVENAIKLSRTWGVAKGGPQKHVIVSFDGSFHGRTLGSQMAGGMPALKTWIVRPAPGFVQIPFPDGFLVTDTSFDLFESSLAKAGIKPQHVAGVISESYQGIGPNFFPVAYAKKLAAWCRKYGALLMVDEVQSGFGRTGKMFAFEHYGITPDLIICGKGITSSLPLSAVIGRDDIMNQYAPGSMTSTHSASPLPVVAAIESLKIIQKDKLAQRAARFEAPLKAAIEKIGRKYARNVGAVYCKGLVGGLLMVKPGTKAPDPETAIAINESCFRKGLLMFAPVGWGGGCIKIAPPLTISRDALDEGCAVLAEAFAETLG